MGRDRLLGRKIPGAGALLLATTAAALAWPLWHWRDIDHPQAGQAVVSLCDRLQRMPELARLQPHSLTSRGVTAGACQWKDDKGRVHLEAALITTRSASGAHPLSDLKRHYEVWRSEALISGAADVVESEEGGVSRLYCRQGSTHHWVMHDHGVLLTLYSERLNGDVVQAAGEAMRADLDRFEDD